MTGKSYLCKSYLSWNLTYEKNPAMRNLQASSEEAMSTGEVRGAQGTKTSGRKVQMWLWVWNSAPEIHVYPELTNLDLLGNSLCWSKRSEFGWNLIKGLACLYKEGNLDTNTQKVRRPCEDRDRDWNEADRSQGTPRMASSHQKLEGPRVDSSLQVSEGAQACQHVDFELLASRTVKEYIAALSVTSFVVILYGSFRKLI